MRIPRIAVAVVASAFLGLVIQSAWAAPLVKITKPPVTPAGSMTGPDVDPDASEGQWFSSAEPTVREYEFYDNEYDGPNDADGGGTSSTNAIYGYVQNVQYSGVNIVAFDIVATITNDLPGFGGAVSGTNSGSSAECVGEFRVRGASDVRFRGMAGQMNGGRKQQIPRVVCPG